MKIDKNNLENTLFEYVDQMKVLISPKIWENVLLDCSKNEMLVLMLLYRRTEVNMTQIAEYINVPLNTATGIIARMERKQMVGRERSKEDKRVVTIALTDIGKQQIESILKEFLYYGQKIMSFLTTEEIVLVGNVLDKVIHILKEEHTKEAESIHKVKKILIE